MSHPSDPHWPGQIGSQDPDPDDSDLERLGDDESTILPDIELPKPDVVCGMDTSHLPRGMVPDPPEWIGNVQQQQSIMAKAAGFDRIMAYLDSIPPCARTALHDHLRMLAGVGAGS